MEETKWKTIHTLFENREFDTDHQKRINFIKSEFSTLDFLENQDTFNAFHNTVKLAYKKVQKSFNRHLSLQSDFSKHLKSIHINDQHSHLSAYIKANFPDLDLYMNGQSCAVFYRFLDEKPIESMPYELICSSEWGDRFQDFFVF